MISAAIIGKSFYEIDKPCVIFDVVEDNLINKLEIRRKCPTILIGINSSIIFNNLGKIEQPLLVINNEETIENKKEYDNKFNVLNSHIYNFKNRETSLSACTYFICSFIVNNLDYIVRLPLIASHANNLFSKFEGLNSFIAKDANTGNITKSRKHLAILGSSVFSPQDGIIFSNNPFLPGLSGNSNEVDKLFAKANIESTTTSTSRKLIDLTKDEITDLNNLLIIHLSTQEGHQEENLVFIKEITIINKESEDSITNNVWDFSTAINDSINRMQMTSAVAVLMGNRTNHLTKLTRLFIEERKAVSLSYQLIIDKRQDIVDLSVFRYFNADRKINWYNTSLIAGMALSNGLVASDYPFAVTAPGPDNLVTIGVRASKNMITESITNVVNHVLEKLTIQSDTYGSNLDVQFSLLKKDVDAVLLQINAYLMSLIS